MMTNIIKMITMIGGLVFILVSSVIAITQTVAAAISQHLVREQIVHNT
ncbi:MAG: hypothetical protein M3Y53_00845 [Thermoproteota archaeon]|nr:hypothetical protein [Thermoproteota archaeon]